MIIILGAIVFVILIVLDVIGHRKYQVRRKLPDWIVLCLFAAGAVFFILSAVLTLNSRKNSPETGVYLAYEYLADGDAASARAVTIQNDAMSATQKNFLEMLASAVEGDYKSVYFMTDRYLSDLSELPEQAAVAEELYTLSMNAVADGKNRRAEVDECVVKSREAAGIRETVQLKEYYQMDRQIRAGNVESIQPADIRALLSSFPDDNSVKKMAISYYNLAGDYDSALQVAGDMLDTEKTPANQILYTDVLAQRAFNITEEELRASEDSEILDLLKKADAAAEKAAAYEQGSDNRYKQDMLYLQYYEDAINVYYQRIRNYLEVKKPVLRDGTGLYGLQLVKMELLQGENEKAYKEFLSIISDASLLDESAPVREELLILSEHLTQYQKSGEDELKETLFEDCRAVFRAQSQDVIPADEEGINRETADQMAAMMIYDHPVYAVTSVNASEFPKITAAVNTNLRKANVFGGSGEYYKDDFKVRDNEESISDFTMTAEIGSENRTLVIAVSPQNGDNSTLKELRMMLTGAQDMKMAKRPALVDGCGQILSTPDDSADRYRSMALSLTMENTATAYEILSQACSVLSGKKNGERAILWVTADPLTEEEQVLEIVNLLKENNVRCYVAALPGANPETAETIASGTGGYCLKIGRPAELTAAAKQLADIMNNRYVFTYRTTDETTDQHSVTISLISEDLDASADYYREGVS